MRYIFVMLLVGCASVKSVKQPFVDIGIDGQPQIIETMDSASELVNVGIVGAGDNLGYQTLLDFEDAKKKLNWPFIIIFYVLAGAAFLALRKYGWLGSFLTPSRSKKKVEYLSPLPTKSNDEEKK